jgi:hypothetical protein
MRGLASPDMGKGGVSRDAMHMRNIFPSFTIMRALAQLNCNLADILCFGFFFSPDLPGQGRRRLHESSALRTQVPIGAHENWFTWRQSSERLETYFNLVKTNGVPIG